MDLFDLHLILLNEAFLLSLNGLYFLVERTLKRLLVLLICFLLLRLHGFNFQGGFLSDSTDLLFILFFAQVESLNPNGVPSLHLPLQFGDLFLICLSKTSLFLLNLGKNGSLILRLQFHVHLLVTNSSTQCFQLSFQAADGLVGSLELEGFSAQGVSLVFFVLFHNVIIFITKLYK